MHGSYISIDWRQACEGASLILPPMEAMAHLVRWFWMIDLLEMTIFQVVKCGNCFSHFRGSMSILPYIAKSWPFQLFWTHCYDWSCHVMSRGHIRQIFTKHLRSVQNFIGGLVDYCLMHVDSHLSFWRNPHLKALKDHFCLVSIWLVVEPPLWKIWKSVGMIIPNIYMEK